MKLDSIYLIGDVDWEVKFDEAMEKEIDGIVLSGAGRAERGASTNPGRKPSAPSPKLSGDIVVNKGPPTRRRGKKKLRGMPKRPLSAYNLFFQQERQKMFHETAYERISFEELGRVIGKRWKSLGSKDRAKYEAEAEREIKRYRREMDAYDELRRLKLKQASSGQSPQTPPAASADVKHPVSPCNDVVATTQSISMEQLPPLPLGPPVLGTACHRVSSGTKAKHSDSADTSSLEQFMTVPPGMEVILPDEKGVERQYVIKYAFYRMTRAAAEQYAEQLRQASTSQHVQYTFTQEQVSY